MLLKQKEILIEEIKQKEDTLDFCPATLAAFEQKSPVSQTKFIFNWYNCTYYADDVYGKMEDKNNG